MNHYKRELEKLKSTYEVAMDENVDRLKAAIAGSSEASIIGVGSGGSFTTASLLCNFHETYTGRVSRASTPLEIICNPTLASSSPVFLISAEGKNPDISEALDRARHHSARPVHIITNRSESPLVNAAAQLSDVSAHVFEMREKDGYLATNSLLMDAVLVARAYGELDGNSEQLPSKIENLKIGEQTVSEWIESGGSFIKAAAERGALIITYSPLLHPIAIDFESRLSEAALIHCQLADLRSFAHGRHLWLADRSKDIVVLALIEPSLGGLWKQMSSLFPSNVPTFTMSLSGSAPSNLIAGLIAEMHFVDCLADNLEKDPGKPEVPQFGRDLYYMDLPQVIPLPTAVLSSAEKSKYDVLGARWPSAHRRSAVGRAREAYINDLKGQKFRAIVFDYDGTLCASQRKDCPPSEPILKHLTRFVESGITVGIASGRGTSMQKELAAVLPFDVLSKLLLGLYNGGSIGAAANPPQATESAIEFLSHVTRIVRKLKEVGVPVERIKTTHPYQVSIRFRDGLPTDQMWFVVADALRQAGLTTKTLFRSKHSVDVLAPGVSKSDLVAYIVQHHSVDPYQVLTMGDQGAWPGNDVSLLEHRYSLSVDVPSRRLDRGWKLAPSHKRDVDATLWYLNRIHVDGRGGYQILLDNEPTDDE